MTKKIFQSILSVAMIVLLLSFLIITVAMYGYFSGVQEKQLRDELAVIKRGLELSGPVFLDTFPKNDFRVTWIAGDGTVLFDDQENASAMENHLQREEVRQAQQTGNGRSSRYSRTRTEQTIYEAVAMEDGTVLRLSVSRITIFTLVFGMLQFVAYVVIFALVLSGILASRMAKRLVEPLGQLDLEHPMENRVYEELSPLLRRLEQQRRKIAHQMDSLRQKQDEFLQITGNMQEGLVLLDKSEKVVSLNPAARKLFQMGEEGADYLAAEGSVRQTIEKAKVQGHAQQTLEAQGRSYRLDVSNIQSQGESVGMVLLSFDITQQLAGERMRREFTANVSHELKTPLQGIIGSAELMETGLVKAEDVPQFSGVIRKEGKRLLNLIEDIIRLSQLDEGIRLPREQVSLWHLCREVTEALEPVAKEKDIRLSVAGSASAVLGVRRLLHEIVYNLCDNGIKYGKVGGYVELTVGENSQQVLLTVKDNGIGIAEDQQEKIFERFYRVDKSHSKASGGTGLGLSIVKHAVAYHGGKIQMQSKPDQGTEITISIPKNEMPVDCA